MDKRPLIERAPLSRKLVIVGDSMCGKTSLLNDASEGRFLEGEVYLDPVDTEGLEEYDRFRPRVYPDTDVVIMCYSINNHDSLLNIQDKWNLEVRDFCPNVPVILVGNKKDMRVDKAPQKKHRNDPGQVTEEEGRQMAEKIGAEAFLECSAEPADGVQAVFEVATRTAVLLKRKKKKARCLIL